MIHSHDDNSFLFCSPTLCKLPGAINTARSKVNISHYAVICCSDWQDDHDEAKRCQADSQPQCLCDLAGLSLTHLLHLDVPLSGILIRFPASLYCIRTLKLAEYKEKCLSLSKCSHWLILLLSDVVTTFLLVNCKLGKFNCDMNVTVNNLFVHSFALLYLNAAAKQKLHRELQSFILLICLYLYINVLSKCMMMLYNDYVVCNMPLV